MVSPRTPTAGGRKAPRQEIAGWERRWCRNYGDFAAGAGVDVAERGGKVRNFATRHGRELGCERVTDRLSNAIQERKPKHVSFLFGAADEFVGCIRADVAVICTYSDVEGMKLIGKQFAPVVIDVYGDLIAANPDAFDPDARQARFHI
jgi:hypothetical protein